MRYFFVFLLWLTIFLCHFFLHQASLKQRIFHGGKKPIQVEGIIETIPNSDRRHSRFEFLTSRVNHQPRQIRLQLSWYGHRPWLSAGERWRLCVKIKPVQCIKPWRGFDYGQWLWRHGIQAKGYVESRASNGRLAGAPASILAFRQQLAKRLYWSTPFHQAASVIVALVVGSRAYLTKDTWRLFQLTGTSHLVAISGLHIGLLALVGFWLASYLWRCWPRLLLVLPAQMAGWLGSLVFAIGYALLAGLSLPTQRAMIMLFIMLLSSWRYLECALLTRLLLAMAVILCVEPFAIYSVSFWLSFMAVFSISYALLGRYRLTKWQMWWHLQIGITLVLLPVNLWFFQQQPLITMVANSVAIPWVSFVVLPLSLLAALCMSLHIGVLGHALLWLTIYSLKPLIFVLRQLASLGWIWHHDLTRGWNLGCCTLAVLAWLAPRGLGLRYLAGVLLVCSFVNLSL